VAERWARSWRRAALCVAVLCALTTAGCGSEPEGTDAARAILRDESRFGSPMKGAEAFAAVSDALFDVGTSCQRDQGRDAPACAKPLQAAAFAQVMATVALRCTPAPMQQTRVALERHLEDPTSELPAIPTCA
jgi:hypothetical protein